jgi:hypothetical protein
MSDVPAPLQSFLLYHRSMREGAERLAAALASIADRDRGDRLPAIAAWFDRYRTACIIHADGEDEVLWPALRQARPDLGDLFATMDAEHTELAASLDRVAIALAAAEVGEAALAAKELAELVDRHLDDEEAAAVPALVAALGPEVGDLMRRVQQNAGPDGAAVAVPFLLEHATDAERATVLAGLPPAVQNGLVAWEEVHRELSATLDGEQR